MTLFKATAPLQTTILLAVLAAVVSGCKKERKPKIDAKPAGATGVCFSSLSAIGKEGAIVTHRQVVVVDSSKDLQADIERVKISAMTNYIFKNPDLVPNTWHSAWVWDDRVDATSGPDCSRLPMIGNQQAT